MTSKIAPLDTPAGRPERQAQNQGPAWTRSSIIAVIITSSIALIGIFGGKWIADLLGLFIGWAAVLAVMIIAVEFWALARLMNRVHASAAAGMTDLTTKPVRRAA